MFCVSMIVMNAAKLPAIAKTLQYDDHHNYLLYHLLFFLPLSQLSLLMNLHLCLLLKTIFHRHYSITLFIAKFFNAADFEVPDAHAQAINRIGNSSIKDGIISPLISAHFNFEYLTLILPKSSLDTFISEISISAPIPLRTVTIPVLNLFMLTLRISIQEPSTMRLATIKNAAEDMSDL